MKFDKKSRYIFAFQCIIILAGYALLWNRIRFGIDFTDESWYVAEPYIVAKGAIPYVNNWTQAPGFTLPLALLFKLYIVIGDGTKGIVLFSRVLYAVISFAVYAISIYLVARRTEQIGVFIAMLPLLFLNGYSLYDLTYDTMGVMYLFVGCVMLFLYVENGCKKKEAAASIISGVIIARTIIASPSVLAAWGGILLLLVIRKQWRQLGLFIIGNTIAAVSVIGWCCVQGSILGFLNGIKVFLTEQAYFQIEKHHALGEDVAYVFDYCKPLLGALILLAALRGLKKKFFSQKRLYMYDTVIVCAVCILTGIIKGLYFGSYAYLIRFGWFEAILMALFTEGIVEDKKKEVIRRLAWISGLYFGVYILTSATNVYGFGGREYWLIIPTVLGCLSWYFALDDKLPIFVAVFFINLLLGFLLVKQSYGYVYRDQPIANLTEKIDDGIWKGCYTTPERAKNVILLENYIHSITDEDDDVLFLDQVCFAYLMANGKACTPSTLDPMAFTYKVNTPEVMYKYFESVGKIPDKIIYIDFGRDRELSIDTEWEFNKFVNENYRLVETYDTNSEIIDKFTEGPADATSFYVKYYRRLHAQK